MTDHLILATLGITINLAAAYQAAGCALTAEYQERRAALVQRAGLLNARRRYRKISWRRLPRPERMDVEQPIHDRYTRQRQQAVLAAVIQQAQGAGA